MNFRGSFRNKENRFPLLLIAVRATLPIRMSQIWTSKKLLAKKQNRFFLKAHTVN